MIAEILDRLQRDFPPTSSLGDVEHWKTSVATYAQSLHEIGSTLLDAIRPTLPARILAESTLEVVAPARPEITIAEFRVRPSDDYYESVEAALPSPANPAGPHATGIAFSLSLYRGFANGSRWRRPRFSIEFCVWGERERAAFHALFLGHRRAVQQLVRLPGLEFSSACWFDDVEKPASRNAATRLDRYMMVASDPG